MKNNKPNQDENTTDEPMFGNSHLPKVEIIVSQACLDYRNKPKELILIEECIDYSWGIFNLLMMVSQSEVHRDADFDDGIKTVAHLGQRFADIAFDNIDRFQLNYQWEAKKNA